MHKRFFAALAALVPASIIAAGAITGSPAVAAATHHAPKPHPWAGFTTKYMQVNDGNNDCLYIKDVNSAGAYTKTCTASWTGPENMSITFNTSLCGSAHQVTTTCGFSGTGASTLDAEYAGDNLVYIDNDASGNNPYHQNAAPNDILTNTVFNTPETWVMDFHAGGTNCDPSGSRCEFIDPVNSTYSGGSPTIYALCGQGSTNQIAWDLAYTNGYVPQADCTWQAAAAHN